ncbi:hypothetical protein HKX48_006109 [Thoreauomyces humboldtii]|nr:hypothetical protein HKX48_006109 [Thoreauomyces humboldtii]
MYPYGLTPVNRNPSLLKPLHSSAPRVSLHDLVSTIPSTAIVKTATAHLRDLLPEPTWNHSIRAYLYGVAMVKGQFPDWDWDAEAFYLSCIFHDLGCIPQSLSATKLSFEFYGAFLARDFLLKTADGEPKQELKDLADSVCEVICRHTDFVNGKITVHGQMIQLGTLYDNIGAQAAWVHPETHKDIVKAYPRHGWTACFGHAMREEVRLKPWSHTTFFDAAGIWAKVDANPIAKPFEEAEEAEKSDDKRVV